MNADPSRDRLRKPDRRRIGLPPFLVFDPHATSLAEGARAGLAIAAVVALHEVVQWPGLMETALAAQLTCLCDAGGPWRRRLGTVVTFGVIGALLTAGFGWLRGGPVLLVAPLAGLVVLICAFARAFGQTALQVGNLLTVVLALALRWPAPPPSQAGVIGLTFLGGAAWASLVTFAIWRVSPYRPSSIAVADTLRALAALAEDMRHAARTPFDEARWDFHARRWRHLVRETLDRARDAVLATVRVRGPSTGPAARSWLQLQAADQMFGTLIALSDVLAGDVPQATRDRAERMLRLVVSVLRLLARLVVHDDPAMRPGLARAIAAVRAVGSTEPHLSNLADSLTERMHGALSAAREATLPVVPRRRWTDIVRGNLSRQSDVARHAVRTALVATAAFAGMLHWPTPYGHWFVIMLVLTLQPYLALTAIKAAERVGGTILGGIAAAAIGLFATSNLAIAAALLPLSTFALSIRAVSFGLFMAALTPVVVLLTEIGQPGRESWNIAVARAVAATAGGLTALAASLLLFPRWEPDRVRQQLRAAIAAHGQYVDTVLARQLGDSDAPDIDDARSRAGMASNALEASLQRMMLETRLAPRARVALEAMLTIDAALRRLAGRLSALTMRGGAGGDPRARRAIRAWTRDAVQRLLDGRSELPARPPELSQTDDPVPARLARPLELAAGAMARLPPLS